MFLHVLDCLGVAASTTVFVDDSQANVAADTSLGLVAVQFQDPATLRHDLEALGLLPAVSSQRPPDR